MKMGMDIKHRCSRTAELEAVSRPEVASNDTSSQPDAYVGVGHATLKEKVSGELDTSHAGLVRIEAVLRV